MRVVELLQACKPSSYVYLFMNDKYFDEGMVEDLLNNYCFGDAEVASIEIDEDSLRINYKGE